MIFFPLEGVPEWGKCMFYFFSLEVWNDSVDFMACIMHRIALFLFLTPMPFITLILISCVHTVFPVDKSSVVTVSPDWSHSLAPFLQVCFSFPSVTFSTPVAGATADVETIFWRCGFGSKLAWNSAVLVLDYAGWTALVWLEWEWGRERERQGEFLISQQDD